MDTPLYNIPDALRRGQQLLGILSEMRSHRDDRIAYDISNNETSRRVEDWLRVAEFIVGNEMVDMAGVGSVSDDRLAHIRQIISRMKTVRDQLRRWGERYKERMAAQLRAQEEATRAVLLSRHTETGEAVRKGRSEAEGVIGPPTGVSGSRGSHMPGTSRSPGHGPHGNPRLRPSMSNVPRRTGAGYRKEVPGPSRPLVRAPYPRMTCGPHPDPSRPLVRTPYPRMTCGPHPTRGLRAEGDDNDSGGNGGTDKNEVIDETETDREDLNDRDDSGELNRALSSAGVVLRRLWFAEEDVAKAEKARLRAMERLFLVNQRRFEEIERRSVALGELNEALLKLVEAWEGRN